MEDFFGKINQEKIEQYQAHLEKLVLSEATIKRRLSALRKFTQWAKKEGYLEKITTKEVPVTKKPSLPKITWFRGFQLSFPPAIYLQKAYRTYHSISITRYFHYSILIIFCAALGFGLYQQFFARAPEPLAYPSALTAPKRYLSFQGRLTDSSDNPITSSTNFTFKLWNHATNNTEVSCDGGGDENCLWSSGTCAITPDQDGIFSVLLGSDCGSEIDAFVFTENAEVWLGIKVASDSEASPRIQIATVAYALNAATLQGYPPGTDASSIPYIDSSGNITIAAASPTLESSSGTFEIKGQALSIVTDTGTNGNITIAPDGIGKFNINVGGSGPGNQIRITDANMTSGNLVSVYAGTDTTGFDLLNLSSGSTETTRFSVDESGNTYVAGNLGIGTTNPSYKLDVQGTGRITGALQLDTVASVADNSQVLTVDSGIVKYIDTSSWDKDSSDDFGAWFLAGDEGTAQSIGSGNTASIVGGVGIGTTASATDTLTIDVDQGYNFAWTGNQSWAGSADFNGNVSIADTDIALDGASTNLSSTGDFSINTFDFFVEKSSANIGIGTTNPGAKLDISGDLKIGTVNSVADNNQVLTVDSGIVKYIDTSSWDKDSSDDFGGWILSGDSGTDQSIGAGETASIVGGIGIGTTASATDTLTIGVDETYGFNWSGTHSYSASDINFTNATSTTLDTTGDLILDADGGDILFSDNGSYFGGWKSGNLGIGTTNPTYPLSVLAGSTDVATFRDTSNSRGLYLMTNAVGHGDFGIRADSSYGLGLSGGTGSVWLRSGTNYSIIFETNGGANEQMRINSSGNIGMGTTSPVSKLDVAGTTWLRGAASNQGLYVNSSGNVGIGTTNPSEELDVVGQIKASTGMYIGSGYSLMFGDGSTRINGNTSSKYLSFYTNNIEAMRIDTNGNVGIGTTAPSQNLHVDGNMRLTGALYDVNNQAGTSGQILSTTGSGVDWVDITSIGVGGSGTQNYLPKWIGSSTLGNSLIYEDGTNVGIGTTGPGYKLSVAGTVEIGSGSTSSQLFLNDSNGSTFRLSAGLPANNTFSIYDNTDGAYRLLIDTGGNVGIGTTAPAHEFVVKQTPNATGGVIYIDDGKGYNESAYLGSSYGHAILGSSKNVYIWSDGDTSDYFRFTTTSNTPTLLTVGSADLALGATSEAIRIKDSSGNVGIGTTNPGAKLDIVGDLKIGTVDSVADNSQVLTVDSGIVKYIDTSSWDKDSSDDFGAWWLAGDEGTAQSIGSGNTASLVGGVGIGTTASATDTLTIGVDETHGFNWSGTHSYSASDINFTNATSTTLDVTGDLHLDADGGDILFSDAGSYFGGWKSGNFGIGTTGPSGKLYIDGVAANNGIHFVGTAVRNDPLLTIEETGSAGGSGGSIHGLLVNIIGHASSGGIIADFQDEGTSRLTIRENGNVGIGTSAPKNKLDISGALALGSYAGTYAAPANGLIVSGNVGIATTSPISKLSIAGTGGASTGLTIGEINSGNNRRIAIYLTTAGSDYGIIEVPYNSGYKALALNPNGGNVGIGKTAPGATLDINGDLKIGTVNSVADNNQVLTVDSGIVKYIDTSSWDKDSSDDFGAWWLAGDEGAAQSIGSGNTASIVGGVGIGTTVSATDTLTIGVDETYGFNWSGTHSYSAADINFTNATSTTLDVTGDLILDADGGDILFSDNGSYFGGWKSGNLGIGTTGPEVNLHLMDSANNPRFWLQRNDSGHDALSRTMSGLELSAAGMNTTNKWTPAIKFMSTDPQFTTENPKFLAAIMGRATQSYNSDTTGSMALDFATTPSNPGATSLPTIQMTIDDNGYVGIGTTDPSYPLHVYQSAGNYSGLFESATGNAQVTIRADTDVKYARLTFEDRDNPDTPIGLLALDRATSLVTGSTQNDLVLYTASGSSSDLHLGTEATVRLTINPSGNVGIGTTNPGAKLDIAGDLKIGTVNSVADNSQVLTVDSGIVKYIDTSSWDKDSSDDFGAWFLAGDEGTAQSIGSGNTASIVGGVGIGTTASATDTLTIGVDETYGFNWTGLQTWSQTATFNGSIDLNNILDLDASDASNYAVNIAQAGNGGGLYVSNTGSGASFRVDDGASDLSPFIIDASGNVGIGTTGPGYKVHMERSSADATLYVKNLRGSGGEETIQADTASTNTSGYLGGHESSPYTNKWYGVRGTTQGGIAVIGRVITSGEAARFLGGSVGIGSSSFSPGGHMLDIESIKGSTGNSAIRAQQYNSGIGGQEFGAIAHREGQWNAIYGRQGSGGAALYTDGEVNLMGGNVGIGTASPNNKLDVVGTVEMTGFKMSTSPSAGYVLTSDASGVGTWTDVSSSAGPWTLTDDDLYPDSTSYNVAIGANDAGSAKLYVSGNLGIGTTNPSQKLEVVGNVALSGAFSAGDSTPDGHAWHVFGTGDKDEADIADAEDVYISGDLEIDGTLYAASIAGDVEGSGTQNYLAKWSSSDALTNSVIYDDGTNVGIGTTGPETELDVQGDLSLGTETRPSTGILRLPNNQSIVWKSSASAEYGFGITSGNKFQFNTTDGAGSGGIDLNGLRLIGDDTGNGTLSLYASNHSASTTDKIEFYTKATERMRIDNSGNLGIGTTGPSYKLDVNGTGRFTGALQLDTVASVSDNNQVLTVDSGIVKYIDTSSWDKDSGDDFGAWWLAGDEGTAQSIGSGNTASIVGGVGIGTTASATDTLTIGVDETYGFSWSGTHSYSASDINFTNATSTTLDVTGDLYLDADGGDILFSDAGSYFGGWKSGNLGIGTTGPSYKLDVAGTGRFTGQITAPSGSLSDPSIRAYNDSDTGIWLDGTRVYIVSSGSAVIDLFGGAGAGASLTFNSPAQNFTGTMTSPGITFTGDLDTGITRIGADDMVLTVGGQAGIGMIDGNVGIGTTNPGAKLDIVGDLKIGTVNSVADNSQVLTVDSGIVKYIDTSSWDKDSSDDFGAWFLAGDEGTAQSIGSGNTASIVGGVGIGTTASATDTLTIGVDETYGFNWSGTHSYSAADINLTNATSTTLDTTGDLILDADGGDILFADNGSYFGGWNTGNFGIGTTGPTEKLEVNGNILLNQSSNPSLLYDESGTDRAEIRYGTTADGLFFLTANASDILTTRFAIKGESDSPDVYFSNIDGLAIGANDPGTAMLYVNGNVGIGTTGPSYKLDVNGTGRFTGALQLDTVASVSDNNIVLTSDSGVVKYIDTSSWDKDSSDDFGGWILSGDSGADQSIGAGNTASIVGGVGIGTTASVTDTLTVSVDETYGFNWSGTHSYSASDINFTNATSTTLDVTGDLYLDADGGDILFADNGSFWGGWKSGNLGIGTTGPGQLLSVQGVGMFGIPNASEVLLGMSINTAGHEGIGMWHDGSQGYIAAVDTSTAWHNITFQGNDFNFQAGGSGGGTDVIIDSSGNIGIGTTGPGYKLDVTGTGRFTSNLTLDTVASVADNNQVLTVDSGIVKYIDTSAWDKSSSDDYVAWLLAGDEGTPQSIGTGNTASIVGGIGIGTTASATDTLTIGVDETYGFNWSGTHSYSASDINFTNATSTTLDVTGDLILDADGGDILFADNGSFWGGWKSGNLGIGTTGPSDKLQILGDIRLGSGATETRVVKVQASSSSPVLKLYSQQDNSSDDNYLSLGRGASNSELSFWGGRAVFRPNSSTTSRAEIYADYGIQFTSSTNDAVTVSGTSNLIVSGGNIGVGTTGPSERVEVAGNIAADKLVDTADSSYYIDPAASGTSLYVNGDIALGMTGSSDDDYIYFDNDTNEYLEWDDDPGQFVLSDDFVPNADDSLDLGSNTARWQDIYLGPGTIHVGTSTSDEYTIGYDTTNNRLEFNVNGSGPAEIVMGPGGNVGIGTTASDRNLRLKSSSTNNYTFTVEASDGSALATIYESSTGYGRIDIHDASGNVDTRFFPEDGDSYFKGNLIVGPDDVVADALLHVVKDQDTTTELRIDNNNAGTSVDHTALTLYNGSTLGAFFRYNNNTDILSFGADEATGEIDIYSGGAQQIRIDSGGNVGIGTTNPGKELDVAGDIAIGIEDTTEKALIIRGGGAGNTEGGQIQLEMAADYDGTYNEWIIDVYEDDLRFFTTAGGVELSITPDGTITGTDFECTNCIDTGELKTATTSEANTDSAGITMHDYSFFPNHEQDDCSGGTASFMRYIGNYGDDTVGRFRQMMDDPCTSGSYDTRWRYITASDHPIIWVIADTDGTLKSVWQGEDPLGQFDYPENPSPYTVADLKEGQRAVNVEPLTVNQLESFYNSLPQVEKNEVLTILRNYVVNERGWLKSLAMVTDLNQISERYQPSARLWAMRFLAQYYEIDPAELILELMLVPDKQLVLKSNIYQTLQTHLEQRQLRLEENARLAEELASLPANQQNADLAEWYTSQAETETPQSGEIISIGDLGYITQTLKPYDQRLMGIISTSPKETLGKKENDEDVKVAITGRVPTKVSAINGPISPGDPITSSEIPGVGMKATKPGMIIGKALESFDETQGETCDQNPEQRCGQILVFINLSWYDPDVYLTDTGDLNIQKEGEEYVLRDLDGNLIDRVGAFAEAAIAELRAGLINTQEIVTNKLASQEITTQKLITPLIESQEVDTERISLREIEAKPGEDIVFDLDNQGASESGFSRLIIKGENGEIVASIDASGSAEFETVEAKEIHAQKVVAEEIVGLESRFGELIAATVSAQTIQGLKERLAQLEEPPLEEEPAATDSGELLSDEEIEELVNQILGTSLEATPQAELSEIYGDNLSISEDLTVLGITSLADTTIAGSLSLDGTMTLADNSINSLTGPLYLQNLGLGGLDILAGKITIDEQGNAVFGSDVTIKGRLALNEIKPLIDEERQDLTIDLSLEPAEPEGESRFGELLVKGVDDEIVASIEASGTATFKKLAIANAEEETTQVLPTEIETNATAGEAILPAGETEITVKSPFVTENTLVYVTPISDSQNKVLFIEAKKAHSEEEMGWFRVAVDTAISVDIKFNWWIIN